MHDMNPYTLLHNAFHQPKHRLFKIVEPIIWVMISLSILVLLIDLSLSDSHQLKPTLILIDRGFILFFTIEYIGRIGTYEPPDLNFYKRNALLNMQSRTLGRLRFATYPMNLIDLLTILGGIPWLRGLRALRLLRLLRLLKSKKFFRYSNPLYGLVDAFIKNNLLYMLVFSILGSSVIIGGLSIFLVERIANSDINSIADGLWWAVVTITTVGYDVTMTGLGKAVWGCLMIVKCLTGSFAGVVGQTLLSSVLSIREEQFRMSQTIITSSYAGMTKLTPLDTILDEVDPVNPLVILTPSNSQRYSMNLSGLMATHKKQLLKRQDSKQQWHVIVRRKNSPQASDKQTPVFSRFVLI